MVTPIVPLENMLWKPNFGNATKCGLDGELFELEQYMTNNTCKYLLKQTLLLIKKNFETSSILKLQVGYLED